MKLRLANRFLCFCVFISIQPMTANTPTLQFLRHTGSAIGSFSRLKHKCQTSKLRWWNKWTSGFLLQTLLINGLVSHRIEEWSFKGLKLETVVVVMCGLSEAPNIQQIAHSLHELDLYRNEISSLSLDYFHGCDVLKSLSFGNNGFKTIPNITKIFDTIETLHMNDNRFSDVSMLYDAKFLRAKMLNLANNYIDAFTYPKWRWPRLRLLQLQHNCIKSITHEWFWEALEPLILVAHNNSWDCTKDLCWLRKCSFGHSHNSAGYECGRIGSWMSLHWGMVCASPLE